VPPEATSTTEPPVATTTTAPGESGSAFITVTTADGSDIPDGTTICADDDCQDLDAIASLIAFAAPSGSQVSFGNLSPGTRQLIALVNGETVYAAAIEIVSGETIDVTIVLQAGDPASPPAPNPTTGPAYPEPTAMPVTTLPSTGTRSPGGASEIFLVLLGGLLVLAGLAGWRARTR
jgi:hypothetical protein